MEDSFQFLSDSKTEKQRYLNHLKPLIGSYSISLITPIKLETIKIDLLAKGLAPQTVMHIISLVKRTYNLLINWELFKNNPASKLKISLPDNRRNRYLTKNEANILLDTLKEKSIPTWRMSLLSLSTGMRAGEIFNIKGVHVDLNRKTLKIVDTKSNRNRIVYIPGAALKMLSELSLSKNNLIFCSKFGGKINSISKTFPRIVDELGFNDGITDNRDKVVFHTLRHTFASWLIQSGETLHVVGELLGHSTLEMTKRYAHLTPEIKQAATTTINSYIDL